MALGLGLKGLGLKETWPSTLFSALFAPFITQCGYFSNMKVLGSGFGVLSKHRLIARMKIRGRSPRASRILSPI